MPPRTHPPQWNLLQTMLEMLHKHQLHLKQASILLYLVHSQCLYKSEFLMERQFF